MIKVNATFNLSVNVTVELKMSVEEFDALTEEEQEELLDSTIDWHSAVEDADTDSCDIWDVTTKEEFDK